ncbi:MAG: tRNA (N6-isopentenyl adenosine(37)-C2)-methylthiotransferase MiaB [Bacteroidales bacterium]|jgi:tRNA-2-methylthio-N6-dimethylallyladenosine synthase|nr:tRNA (N6-isopentenyl adenosine(37)-C2)-methylthiotransferase MiaB [Bacteroidales bacterium]
MKMKKLYIETFGCQMNIADSEVVASILKDENYELTINPDEADLYLFNTCAVRENAEKRIWNKLQHFKGIKRKNRNLKLGVIGCMAQHIGNDFKQTGVVDFIAGPDAYRNIPNLLKSIDESGFQADTELSLTETYEAILPTRINNAKISGFVSITRGCNNFCSYCIVPYTRGRERSRKVSDIMNEVQDLQENGYREITLLGQNVNSYNYTTSTESIDFPKLLALTATRFPDLRIRFTTSHPKDISDELIECIANHDNICNHIHLPIQSGSNEVLKRMNRKYTLEWYLDRIQKIRELIPDCGITTDIFAGFCGEMEADHQQSLDVMKQVGFDAAFMFKYSEREGTYAAKHLDDDVPEAIKIRRLNELITLQNQLSLESNQRDVGKSFRILIEGKSKRSETEIFGRTCQNKVVIIPDTGEKIGDFVPVTVNDYTSATLFGTKIS